MANRNNHWILRVEADREAERRAAQHAKRETVYDGFYAAVFVLMTATRIYAADKQRQAVASARRHDRRFLAVTGGIIAASLAWTWYLVAVIGVDAITWGTAWSAITLMIGYFACRYVLGWRILD